MLRFFQCALLTQLNLLLFSLLLDRIVTVLFQKQISFFRKFTNIKFSVACSSSSVSNIDCFALSIIKEN